MAGRTFSIALGIAAVAFATAARAESINAGERPATAERPFAVEAVGAFDTPWAIAFLPDGRMLVTEKPGAIFLVTRLFRDLSPGQKESLKHAVLIWSAAAVILTGSGVTLGGFCPFEKNGWFFGLATHEVGGIVILAWCLLMLGGLWRYRRARDTHKVMPLAVVGNIVVILGWLGLREGLSTRVRVAWLLAFIGAAIMLAGALITTSGERAKGVTRALVDAAVAEDMVGALGLFSDDATLHVGSPQAPELWGCQ